MPLWLPTRHVGVASWFSFLSAHDIRHLFHLAPQSTPPPSTETPTSFDVKYLSGPSAVGLHPQRPQLDQVVADEEAVGEVAELRLTPARDAVASGGSSHTK